MLLALLTLLSLLAGLLNPFSQQNFPCQEDEALVYDFRFGPDRTGCVPLGELIARD